MDEDNLVDEEELYLPDVDDEGRNNGYSIILSLVQLHSGQMKVFKSPHRFKVVCAGRRWGKSRLSISKIIKAAAADRKQRVWYVAPTYQMARQILWDDLQEVLPRKWIAKRTTLR